MASLHWRCWNDEWAVFDVGSGQTHQMDTLTAVTLMMVDTTPVDLHELVDRVADELFIPANPELFNALKDTLDRLVAAQLIESALP